MRKPGVGLEGASSHDRGQSERALGNLTLAVIEAMDVSTPVSTNQDATPPLLQRLLIGCVCVLAAQPPLDWLYIGLCEANLLVSDLKIVASKRKPFFLHFRHFILIQNH